MFASRVTLVVIVGFVVAVNCAHHRRVRSPDKMEVDVPNYSSENNQNQLNEEGEYWQGQGEKMNDDRNNNSGKNQEQFDNEKEYREGQQQDNNKEMEDDLHKNKDKLESQQQENDDHYHDEHEDDEIGNPPNNDLGSKEERYGEKGKEGMSEREEKMENYDPESQGPSMTYERS